MELINSIPLIGPLLAVVLPFLVVLSIVVAIHELGHLLVGRWCGIKAEVYSVGFGKVLWSRVDRHGTRWQIAALPLGGYVKFLGDMDPASAGRVDDSEIPVEDRPKAFHNAALWRRTLAVVAGPVANFLLSALIFFCLALYSGKNSTDPVINSIGDMDSAEVGFAPGDRILQVGGEPIEYFNQAINILAEANGAPTSVLLERDGREIEVTTRYNLLPIVTGMQADGAAAGAGLRPGDRISGISGQEIHSAYDARVTIAELPHNEEIVFSVTRDGDALDIAFTPKLVKRKHPVSGEEMEIPFLGIVMNELGGLEPEIVPVTFGEAARYGVLRVWGIIRDTMLFLREMIFNGADTSQLSGPIGIAKFSGDAAEQGLPSLIHLVAFLSTAVGLFNLFPIPILDGGHLMFYAVEALRGKPIGEALMRYGTMLGLSLVLLLMVFVTYNDFMRL